MSKVLLKFPNRPVPRPYVTRASGLYLHLEGGRRLMDISGGWTHHATLGYSHPEVLAAMQEQLGRFTHIDYDMWRNRDHDELAEILLSQAPNGLDLVYFCGNSGSEATEAAMKLSYQTHYDQGKRDKQWVISRDQSYHGATLQSMAISERDILDFYSPLFPEKRARIAQHNPSLLRHPLETPEAYGERSAQDLEQKILELGADKVFAFIAETQLGALIGDVPPAPGYWRKIREICDRHDVHLILDEVYCGLGRSGKIYNCSWDGITPDFVCLGKTLASGYAPLSAVVTKRAFIDAIGRGQGRVQHGHTHQGYGLGTAAALAVQKIVHRPETLANVSAISAHMTGRLQAELGDHPFFFDLRGRGLAFALEYRCRDRPAFGAAIQQAMEDRFDIVISAKWHRISFTPPFTITRAEADQTIDALVAVFKDTADRWPSH
jgi:adenosylmethionine-8-amino-7-oxononanoate aminotransferase